MEGGCINRRRAMREASRFEGRADEETRGLGVGRLTCGRFGATCIIISYFSFFLPVPLLPTKTKPSSPNDVTMQFIACPILLFQYTHILPTILLIKIYNINFFFLIQIHFVKGLMSMVTTKI